MSRRRAAETPMPKLQSVAGVVPQQSGANQDGRKVGRSTGRDYKFNTNLKKSTHDSMKLAAAKTGSPVGLLVEEAWALWLAANKDKLK